MFRKTKIQSKITVLLVALLALALLLNSAWSRLSQTEQAEAEMLEKTQILNQQMLAVWEYIDMAAFESQAQSAL